MTMNNPVGRKLIRSLLALAIAYSARIGRAALPAPADLNEAAIQLPAYQVTAPKFISRFAERREQLDNLNHSTWVNAKGGALIQAIIWRHEYLRVHPADEAAIFIHPGVDGSVAGATTVYTDGGKLYANSYALGAHQRLGRLTKADFHDSAKILQIVDGIRDEYQLDASLAMAGFHAGSAGGPVLGDLIAASESPNYPDNGEIIPPSLQVFGGGHAPAERATWTYTFEGDQTVHPRHAPSETLDMIYRALHDPDRAGVVPVALSPVTSAAKTAHGTVVSQEFALIFDWAGIHYVYQPHSGTVGHPIPTNPVTGLPYLCVRDSGLIESIYFAATYRQSHPGEKAVVVANDDPAVAFTTNRKMCLFCPSLNHFALLTKVGPDAVESTDAVRSSIARIKAALANLPAHATGSGQKHGRRVPENMAGDTADLQMRRIFVAFQAAGIPVHLSSGEVSSLQFRWEGVNYTYGPDQQLRSDSRS